VEVAFVSHVELEAARSIMVQHVFVNFSFRQILRELELVSNLLLAWLILSLHKFAHYRVLNRHAHDQVELSVFQFVLVELTKQDVMSWLQLLAEEDSVVSLNELAAVRLDPVVLITSTSSVVPGVARRAQERLVRLVHVILMHPEHADIAAISALLTSVLPTVVIYLVHGIVRYALNKLWVIFLVNLFEELLETWLVLLLLVDGHFLPGVNKDLSIFVADVDVISL
jgi:hypothetical protein